MIFINTGFLDRTGDEIHTSMELGPMIRKNDMKNAVWLVAYERNNVSSGLKTGFKAKRPNRKRHVGNAGHDEGYVEQKIGHPKAGANTAWVPSPTAATSTHCITIRSMYRRCNKRSGKLESSNCVTNFRNSSCRKSELEQEEIRQELENNAQDILGYVVRWIDQGIGCSKVPDINNIGLMEDRATLRISSQTSPTGSIMDRHQRTSARYVEAYGGSGGWTERR